MPAALVIVGVQVDFQKKWPQVFNLHTSCDRPPVKGAILGPVFEVLRNDRVPRVSSRRRRHASAATANARCRCILEA